MTAANQEVARGVRQRFGFDVCYVGAEERRALSKGFLRAGLDPEVVRFAIHGLDSIRAGTLGANRNLLLLATTDEAFLSVDDDTVCRFASPPTDGPAISVDEENPHTRYDPATIWVYSSYDALFASVPLMDADVLGMHQALLGQNPADLVGTIENNIDSSGQELSLLREGGGRVLVSLNGVVGDCGWGSPSRYLFVDDLSFERLTPSARAYAEAISSRIMLRVVASPLISEDVEDLMSTAFAADNRPILPPFVPVGRGEDVVFGRLLKKVHPRGWFGHVPHAILHTPPEGRRFWPGEVLRSASATDIKGMFCDLLSCPSLHKMTSGEDAIRKTGQTLMDFGSQSPKDFHALLVDCGRRTVAEQVAFLQRRMTRLGRQPTAWSHDVDAYIRALEKRDWRLAAVPAELQYCREIDQAVELARKMVSLYGRLLALWPDMICVARLLKPKVDQESGLDLAFRGDGQE
jgi:hypothetical protein